MALLIAKENFREKIVQKSFRENLFVGGEIPSKEDFINALSLYNSRMTDYNCNGVNLLNDTRVLYFKTETMDKILSTGTHLVARYGCEDSSNKYSQLTISLCSMITGKPEIVSSHYIGTYGVEINNHTHEDKGTQGNRIKILFIYVDYFIKKFGISIGFQSFMSD